MKARIKRLSTSNRRKLTSILLAVVIFGLLTVLTTLALGRNPIYGVLNAIMVGTSVGLFEQFYIQNARGRWFRSIHPLKSMLIYTGIVAVVFILSIHLVRLIFWHFDDLPWVYRRLPVLVPIVITFSVIGIVVMRVAHFVGLETLFHLTIGTYHRPVVEEKVLMFLDINNSTALAAQLGAIETKSFVGKFLFDISAPITNNGGVIYLYKGDGLIALWDWDEALSGGKVLARSASSSLDPISSSSAWARSPRKRKGFSKNAKATSFKPEKTGASATCLRTSTGLMLVFGKPYTTAAIRPAQTDRRRWRHR
jgi:adenylate cyclase